MSSFTLTLDLPHPPAALFRYLAEPRNRPEWQSSLKAVDDIDPGEPHEGMHWRDITKVGIKPHLQLTEVVPFRTLSEIGTWHGVDGLLTLRFVKVGDGHPAHRRGPGDRPRAVRGRGRRGRPVGAGDDQGRPRARQRPAGGGVAMRRWALVLLAVGMMVVGLVWTFQGLGYLEGSAMSGQDVWAVIGPAVAGSASPCSSW